MLLEDNPREGDDPTPAEPADGTETDPATDDPNTPGEGDVPADQPADGNDDEPDPDPEADPEGEPDDDLDPDAIDDDDDDPANDKRTVPFGRLRDVVRQRNTERTQKETYAKLLREHGIDIASGKKGDTPAEDKAPKVDLSKYKPEEIKRSKALLSALLQEEFGVIGTIKEQVEQLSAHQQQELTTRAQAEDDKRLAEALKDPSFKGIEKETVKKQVLKWAKSEDPELQSLARAPYRYVVQAIKDMKDRKVALKKKPAPKVDAPADAGPKKPHEKTETYDDPVSFRRSIRAGARAYMERAE